MESVLSASQDRAIFERPPPATTGGFSSPRVPIHRRRNRLHERAATNAPQRMMLRALVIAATCLVAARAAGGARGFNDNIDWTPAQKCTEKNLAAAHAANPNKPHLVLVHKTWCGACKALKGAWKDDASIEALSENFVMTNCEDDEEPDGEKWTPDGGYIPRLMFVGDDGNLLSVTNEKGNPQYKYYYSSPAQVTAAMESALEKYAAAASASDEL